MLNINDVLYKYISDKYGSIAAFSDYSGISLIELNAILLKDNISTDIRSGLRLCQKLNINVEKLVFEGEIEETAPEQENHPELPPPPENPVSSENSENELYDRYMRLSGLEKKEVLDFVNKLCERHENL